LRCRRDLLVRQQRTSYRGRRGEGGHDGGAAAVRLPQRHAGCSAVNVTADGRRLLRLEARNAQTPIEAKPSWIKMRVRTGPAYRELKQLVEENGLHTVCE